MMKDIVSFIIQPFKFDWRAFYLLDAPPSRRMAFGSMRGA